MKIEPKFDIDQTVWVMEGSAPNRYKIREINISICKHGTTIGYKVDGTSDTLNESILYASPNDLLNDLANYMADIEASPSRHG